jgi:acyl carrier protein
MEKTAFVMLGSENRRCRASADGRDLLMKQGDSSVREGIQSPDSRRAEQSDIPPEQSGILEGLQDIVRDVIDDESIMLSTGTTARDVAGWDSLVNIRIILAAEKAFGIKVSTTEIMSLRNVGDFVRLVASRRRQ